MTDSLWDPADRDNVTVAHVCGDSYAHEKQPPATGSALVVLLKRLATKGTHLGGIRKAVERVKSEPTSSILIAQYSSEIKEL